jgi:peroxiredoxin
MPILHNGDSFPELKIPAVGGGSLAIPRDLAGSYGVVLIYRGSWCPYCNAQLAAFGRAQHTLEQLNAKVVAFSVDAEDKAEELVRKHKLGFPVGYSADADEIAAAVGSYTNAEPKYLNSTGFVLDPDGKVITAAYSSGAIGRLTADDVIGFVRYVQSNNHR